MIHLKLLEKQEQANPKQWKDKNKNKSWNQWNRNEKKKYKELMKQKVGSLEK
jgi:hypothetical protein